MAGKTRPQSFPRQGGWPQQILARGNARAKSDGMSGRTGAARATRAEAPARTSKGGPSAEHDLREGMPPRARAMPREAQQEAKKNQWVGAVPAGGF